MIYEYIIMRASSDSLCFEIERDSMILSHDVIIIIIIMITITI